MSLPEKNFLMQKVIPDSPEERKDMLYSLFANPEFWIFIALALGGTSAAGYYLIGFGFLLAFIPVIGLVGVRVLRKKKR